MAQYLPYGGFEWMSEEEINEINFDLVREDSDDGYVLGVDLEYPDDLHDLHNDYPLAPEKLKVKSDMLSDYCLNITEKYGIKVGEVDKLIPNLKDKETYIVHCRNLQLYLSLGMKVVKIHKVLNFKQSDWLKNLSNSILKKECALLINLKRIFLNLWLITFLVKRWKI